MAAGGSRVDQGREPPSSPGTRVRAVAAWLERIHIADGYGGPTVHWWRDALLDCRPGVDWRYEGIVAGYLALDALERRSGATASQDRGWLALARRAGDEITAAQGADGHYARSRFELNPGRAGTPHEAAASWALLRLAETLAEWDPAASERYLAAAEANLRAQIDRLWDGEAGAPRDDPSAPSFVPNKACTLVEALLLLARLRRDGDLVPRYVAPTVRAVLRLQVRRRGDRLDGAIAQNSLGRSVVAKYFPYYAARCIPGLLAAHSAIGQDELLDAAIAAGRFVASTIAPDGGLPQVLYEGGLVNHSPRWVAGAGDVLRALRCLRAYGERIDTGSTEEWLAAGLCPDGSVRSASGFATRQLGRDDGGRPDARDLLPCPGWVDKAFRFWAETLETAVSPPGDVRTGDASWTAPCRLLEHPLELRVDGGGVRLLGADGDVYRWRYGDAWASASAPWMALR